MIQNFIKPDIHDYSELIKSNKIQHILNAMPEGLTKLEKAYYVYLELGKILSENPKDVLTTTKDRIIRFGTAIDENFFGICLSICELYANILKDDRIGIETDILKRIPNKQISHYDAILKIDGKNYLTSLIRDLTNIKTNMKTKWFAFNPVNFMSIRLNSIDKFATNHGLNKNSIDTLIFEIKKTKNNDLIDDYIQNLESQSDADYERLYRLLYSVSYEQNYLGYLRHTYDSISHLSTHDIEIMDSKFGYSFGNGNCGLYTNDVLNKMREEFKNNEVAKKYILKGNHIYKSELLDYKLEFITQNINKFIELNGEFNYLEQITSFGNFLSMFISPEESKRIVLYALKTGNTEKSYVSLIKVKPYNQRNDNSYYLYSSTKQIYERKSIDELKEYFSSLPPSEFQIIGKNKMYDPDLANLNTKKDIEDELTR